MTPKSKSEFSSTEAIPLPALDPNPNKPGQQSAAQLALAP